MPALRWIAAASLVNTVGAGLFMSISVLYFTQVVGFGIAQVAVVMTVAGLTGPLAAVPLGHLADRLGPRPVLITLLTAMGTLSLGYAFVTQVWQYAVIATLVALLERGVSAVGGALIASLTAGPQRVRARAAQNVAFGAGIATGSGLALIVLSIGTSAAYRTAIVLDAATFVLSGVLYLKVASPIAVSPPSPWMVFRDRRFVRVVALFSLLETHRAILTVALPIWIVQQVHAPAALVPLAVLINVLSVVLLQIPISRRIETLPVALRAGRAGGALLLVTCLLFALAPAVGPALLIIGVLLQTAADLAISSSRFCVTFELADDRAQGQYQGFVSIGRGVTTAVAPSLMAWLPLGLGLPGWLLLGLLFLATGRLLGADPGR